MPADILLYALIAAGLIFWLKTILGTRHEDEGEGSSIFSDHSDDETLMSQMKKAGGESENNVVHLNSQVGDKFDLPFNVHIENKTAENALEDILQTYENFDLVHFSEGAQQAFVMIIEAFDEGDLETLENLLAPPVYDAFKSVIKDRESRKETAATDIKEVSKTEIIEAVAKDKKIFITVRFTAQETRVIRDSDGQVIAGDPERIVEAVDVWRFGKDADAQGPEWLVYETLDEKSSDEESVSENSKDKK